MSDETGTLSLTWAVVQTARSKWIQRYLFQPKMEAVSVSLYGSLLSAVELLVEVYQNVYVCVSVYV